MHSQIPSIASRLDILADIADQMEHNEENSSQNQQQLLLQYFLQSIQKQKQDQPVDFSTKLAQQSASSARERTSRPLAAYSSSNIDLLKQVYNRLQQAQDCSLSSPKRVQSGSCSPDLNQPGAYSERRKKNNEAAKRSRDARRVKEDEIAMRATWLEQENVKLRLENAQLKQENIQLRCRVYSSNAS